MVLEEAELTDHLVARGLVPPGAAVTATALAGGVSGDVSAVSGGGLEAVVKRPSPRLRVAEEWLADEERVVAEGWALRFAADLVPASVPRVIDLDLEANTLVIERAPAEWREWRATLLAGEIDPAVGEHLGRALASWHRRSREYPRLLASFADQRAFVQLRIAPFHLHVAERHPDLATEIEAVVDRLLERRVCLVHGDFSPKNVLAGPTGTWVLDWEVAHIGDPDFDLAYMLCHLTLKEIHLPAHGPAFRELASRFLDAYGAVRGPELAANVACLLLARVDGKSPATYLTSEEREQVRSLARRALRDPELIWSRP